jgi:thiosulfate/3-mercaptopyruvate sulfurtransferase
LNQTVNIEDQSQISPLPLPALIVPPDWLAQHLEHPGLRLLDVRTAESYAQGHIPNAVRVELAALTGTVNGVPGMLLPPEPFAARMSQLGVDQEKTVMIYDDNWGLPAARVLWSLACYGHSQVAVLNGGWDRWYQESRPITSEPFVPPPARFVVQPADEHLAERAWLLERLDDPNTVLVDTRTAGEYVQGHLPGAIRWDWMNGVPVGSWDAVRPAEELRTELANLGITPDKEIVTYCRSGARAAHTYLLLRYLGYPRVRNYDGSWLEWSRYGNSRYEGGRS